MYSFLAEASENKQAANYNPNTVPYEFFIELCKQVNPNSIAKNRSIGLSMNFEIVPTSWGKMFHNSCHDQVQYLYSKLMNDAPFLETEHIMLLNNVINSSFYSATYLYTGYVKNTDFSSQAKEMWNIYSV